jgi:hypothetical protein
MAKQRIPIPDDLAAKVLFASDRTCCVCKDRGKPIQIHHIDENPSNNVIENLAILCLDHHDETQIKGGFARKLTPPVVAKYRNEWLKDVRLRRDLANERAVTRQVGVVSISEQIKAEPRIRVRHTQLKDLPVDYINSLPKFKSDLIQQTNKRKRDGSTLDIVQANDDYADSLTGILVTLANYYSPECFGDQSPQEFFSEIISSRFRLHSALAEPDGPGTGGTIAGILRGVSRIADIERIVEDMVTGLWQWEDSYPSEYEDWQKRWRSEEI